MPILANATFRQLSSDCSEWNDDSGLAVKVVVLFWLLELWYISAVLSLVSQVGSSCRNGMFTLVDISLASHVCQGSVL